MPEKKSVTIASVLSFFVFGLFYCGKDTKTTVIYVAGLCILSWALCAFINPTVGLIANIAGAYIGNKWVKEHNDMVDNYGKEEEKAE